jgi:hypothetical protein
MATRRLQFTLEERFYAKVEKIEGGCWLWIGRLNRSGYGDLYYDGKKRRAHRISYEIHVGEVPDGMFVCHSCDVPMCVNPAHLWIGTNEENMRDMVAKGRHKTAARMAIKNVSKGKNYNAGERNARAKLKEADVLQVINLCSQGKTRKYIANQFGVSASLISEIRNGKRWAHLARHDGAQQ